MKSILSIIFISYLFMNPISDSMNINSLPISAKSSAMGGVYIPLGANQAINFSHLSKLISNFLYLLKFLFLVEKRFDTLNI